VDGQTATLITTVGGFSVALAAFLGTILLRLESRMTARMDRLDVRMDRFETRLERMEAELRGEIAGVRAEIAELRDRVYELSGLTRQLLAQRAA
jgi:hypothetical protein